ncbi:hypothetical protein EDF66_103280 [Sphingobacterium sp. JUb20]|nr:hypothetical protein [Sphingobacterium sp. JUb21]TCR08729.1 hypothetical protein EDF66_103280 [Sphingobacterium sp. JUb20]
MVDPAESLVISQIYLRVFSHYLRSSLLKFFSPFQILILVFKAILITNFSPLKTQETPINSLKISALIFIEWIFKVFSVKFS